MEAKRNAPSAAATGIGARVKEQGKPTTSSVKRQEDLSLMDEIMQAVEQTEQAVRIEEENPEMNYWFQLHMGQIDQIPGLTWEQRDDLEQSIVMYGNACAAAFTLYGMHVMNVIAAVSADPQQLSKHVMRRLGLESEV